MFVFCVSAQPTTTNTVLVDIPENIQAEMVSLPTRARARPLAAAAAAPSRSSTAHGATAPLQGHFTGALAPEPARFRAHPPTPISRTVMNEVCRPRHCWCAYACDVQEALLPVSYPSKISSVLLVTICAATRSQTACSSCICKSIRNARCVFAIDIDSVCAHAKKCGLLCCPAAAGVGLHTCGKASGAAAGWWVCGV